MRVVLENDLGADVKGPIIVALPELSILSKAEQINASESSPGVSLDGTKIIIDQLNAGEQKELRIRYSLVLARLTSKKDETIWANQEGAQKNWRIHFNCIKPAKVRIEKSLPQPSTRTSAGFGDIVLQSDYGIASLVNCREGENEAEINYFIEKPFEINRAISKVGEKTIALQYKIKSAFALEGAQFSFLEELQGCAGPVKEQGEITAKTVFEGGLLAIEMKNDFAEGEQKIETIIVEGCNNTDPSFVTPISRPLEESENNSGAATTQPEQTENKSNPVKVAEETQALEAKKALLTEIQESIQKANEESTRYETAYFLPTGIRHTTSLQEKQGEAAVVQAKKIAKSVDSLITAVGSGQENKLAAYTEDFLKSKKNDLEKATAEIYSAIEYIKGLAADELAIAELRQKEFGNSETEKQLAEAEETAANSKFLEALLKAQALNSKLVGSFDKKVSAATGEVSAGLSFWALGAAGLAIIVLLFFLLSKSKKSELKEF